MEGRVTALPRLSTPMQLAQVAARTYWEYSYSAGRGKTAHYRSYAPRVLYFSAFHYYYY